MRTRLLAALSLALFVTVGTSFGAKLTVTKDTTLSNTSADQYTDWGGTDTAVGTNVGGYREALLGFDTSGITWDTSNVAHAVLRFYTGSSNSDTDVVVYALADNAANRSWGEGTGDDVPATSGVACGAYAQYDNTPWEDINGDPVATFMNWMQGVPYVDENLQAQTLSSCVDARLKVAARSAVDGLSGQTIIGYDPVLFGENVGGWTNGWNQVTLDPSAVDQITAGGQPNLILTEDHGYWLFVSTKETGDGNAAQLWLARMGDANYDDSVDGTDFVTLAVNYTGSGGTGKTWEQGDFNGDGAVDGQDFVQLAVNYTDTLSSSVPEPFSLTLLGLGGLALLRRKRA